MQDNSTPKATRLFNRLCLFYALLWLAVSVPLGIIFRPTYPDFSQFYMGGLMARHGYWRALYPVPHPGSKDNPGLWIHSGTKPRWEKMRQKHFVPDDTRFILPPPSALLFVPLSLTSYERAFWIWTGLLILSTWGVAWVAGQIYLELIQRPSRVQGLLALAVVASPMTIRAIRIANVTPFIALFLGFAVLSLIRRREPALSAASLCMGALLKYATLILTPLLFAMKQWRAVIWIAVFGLFTLFVTFSFTGPGPFLEFQKIIAPTLTRPSAYPGNQTLPGLFVRIFGRPLPATMATLLDLLRFGSLGVISTLLMQVKKDRWNQPTTVVAGASLLISWLLIFSPIAWEHWPIFLVPMWGWLLTEMYNSGWKRLTAGISLLLMYFPAGIFGVEGFFQTSFYIGEPLNSWQLMGAMLVFILSLVSIATNQNRFETKRPFDRSTNLV